VIAVDGCGRTIETMSFHHPRLHQPITIYEAVIGALGVGDPRPRSEVVAEVVSRTGAAPGAISAKLSELVANGVLLRPARGVYQFNSALLGPNCWDLDD
jgi:hypothetical protein